MNFLSPIDHLTLLISTMQNAEAFPSADPNRQCIISNLDLMCWNAVRSLPVVNIDKVHEQEMSRLVIAGNLPLSEYWQSYLNMYKALLA